jgi:hypothetical protein
MKLQGVNVKFFGNSITSEAFAPQHFPTFVQTVMNHYNCYDTNDVCRGVARCSEERILFYLKKTKKLDVAVIFHGWPNAEFCVSSVDDYAHGSIDDDEVGFLTSENVVRSFYKNVQQQLPKLKNDAVLRLTPKETQDLLSSHKELFYHIDLQNNRYNGALIQIDQYCTTKGIPVIHCVHSMLPRWFNFTSGIVNKEFGEYQYAKHYGCSYSKSANAINEEGNSIIADTLISYIDSFDFEK